MNNLVEIVNLTKKYGANVAVNNLTQSVRLTKLGHPAGGKYPVERLLPGRHRKRP